MNADAQIEGLVRRAVVAPYDGFIKDATARAGDTVDQDNVLATLEDSDLLLERLKWVTERQEHLYEYDKALAARQPATINVIRSQIDQADAQIKLHDEQIARVKLRSPIAGLVVSGDLSQLIGAWFCLRSRRSIPIASSWTSTNERSAQSNPARPASLWSRRCRTKHCRSSWIRSLPSPRRDPAATCFASKVASATISPDCGPVWKVWERSKSAGRIWRGSGCIR